MDIYSLGVLLFVMLTGHKPMKSEEARNLTYHKYEAYDYPKMSSWTWKRLSKSAQSLVLALMERNPLKRLSADEVRSMLWTLIECCIMHVASAHAHCLALLRASLLLLQLLQAVFSNGNHSIWCGAGAQA